MQNRYLKMETSPAHPQPKTGFDWAIYADATFAGLSVLIPIPGIDSLFETFFRKRIPGTISKRRKYPLSADVRKQLGKSDVGCLKGCLILPFSLTFGLLKKLSRKILYFLTIKQASDQVSFYWHQAFLFDYALLCGHLKDEESARVGKEAARQTLGQTATSPLHQLAIQVTGGARFILRTLFKARRGKADSFVEEKKSLMEKSWAGFSDYFEAIAANYYQTYYEILAMQNRVWQPYPGRYSNDKGGIVEISLSEGRLTMLAHDLPQPESVLVREGRHSFRVRGGTANGNLAVFQFNAEKQVDKLRVGLHLFHKQT